MREYKLGVEYEFIVDYFYTTTDEYGREKLWFSLLDGESVKKYNVPAYPFQKEGYEGKTITCLVSRLLDNGYPYLYQTKKDILPKCYERGETYWFSVLEKNEDPSTNRPYYSLVDRINNIAHRYYCSDKDEFSGVVPFVVDDITDTHLVLKAANKEEDDGAASAESKNAYNPFGHEDEYHEWKSSLVFPSNDTDQDNPDVEKQVKEIMRCIAGFQNTEGGLLYIGVTNDGQVRGIESDFVHLNDGEDANKYGQSTDGFECKIRNAVNHYLGKMSLDNISFKFYRQQTSGHIFCVITVSKTPRPVYREGRDVFKRFGNGFRILKGEEITDLAYDKFKDVDDGQKEFSLTMPDDCLEYNPNKNVEVAREEAEVVKLDKDVITRLNYFYMTFFSDNRFIYSKESHASEANVITEIRFNYINGNLEYSRDILIKCTKDGHAKLMQAFDICKLGEPDKYISLPTEDIFTVRVSHKYDFLKLTFNDGTDDREKYIRVTSLFGTNTEADLRANKPVKDIKKDFRLKGNLMIPSGWSLKDVTVVRECLPDEIQFVSANIGASGKGCIVGQPILDPKTY